VHARRDCRARIVTRVAALTARRDAGNASDRAGGLGRMSLDPRSDLRRRALAALLVLATGCTHAHDVAVQLALAQPDSGALDVVLNGASGALSVTIDGALVVDRKHSRKAHVEGIPAGPARVRIATGGGCEQAMTYDREVEIIPGATVTLALPGPQPDHGCMVLAGLQYIGINIALVALAAVAVVAGSSPSNAHTK
jgi:hypothetical protein